MITSKQCKAARSLLGWTAKDLATKANIGLSVVTRFEASDVSIRKASVEAIMGTFSDANISFIGQNGVIEKEDTVEILKGKTGLEKLWDNIIESLSPNGGEVLITNVDESRTLKNHKARLFQHREKLKENNITERLLSCEGDDTFFMPKEYYRWLPKDVFSMGTSVYIYANKVAFQLWGADIILLVHSTDAHAAEKKRFEYMWENAIKP